MALRLPLPFHPSLLVLFLFLFSFTLSSLSHHHQHYYRQIIHLEKYLQIILFLSLLSSLSSLTISIITFLFLFVLYIILTISIITFLFLFVLYIILISRFPFLAQYNYEMKYQYLKIVKYLVKMECIFLF